MQESSTCYINYRNAILSVLHNEGTQNHSSGNGNGTVNLSALQYRTCKFQILVELETQRVLLLFLNHLLFYGKPNTGGGSNVSVSVADALSSVSASDVLIALPILESVHGIALDITSQLSTSQISPHDVHMHLQRAAQQSHLQQLAHHLQSLVQGCLVNFKLQLEVTTMMTQMKMFEKNLHLQLQSNGGMSGMNGGMHSHWELSSYLRSPLLMQRWCDFFKDYTK